MESHTSFLGVGRKLEKPGRKAQEQWRMVDPRAERKDEREARPKLRRRRKRKKKKKVIQAATIQASVKKRQRGAWQRSFWNAPMRSQAEKNPKSEPDNASSRREED